MTRLLVALVLLSGCAGQVGAAHEEPACYAHPAADFLTQDGLTCVEATAETCGFTAVNEPVPVSPDYPVEFVCHCIGARYWCFGHQP